MPHSLQDALLSEQPAADRRAGLDLYGFLVGAWDLDATVHLDDGTVWRGAGEVHAGWALGGRAIIDVWILPGIFHGSTLRMWDPGTDDWHIVWSDPLRPYFARQTGRAEGADIVQIGTNHLGEATRWSFRDIQPGRFLWRGERSFDQGATWGLQSAFTLHRRG